MSSGRLKKVSCVTQRMQPLLLAVSWEDARSASRRTPVFQQSLKEALRRKERREEPRPALTRAHQCLCPVKRMTFVATVPVTSCRCLHRGAVGNRAK